MMGEPFFSSLSVDPESPGSLSEQQIVNNNSTSTLCLLKQKKLTLSKPAFDISLVRNASQHGAIDDDEVQCASKCFPISAVNPFIFLGSWKDAQNLELLRQHNIRYVLNVAEEIEVESSQTWAELTINSYSELQSDGHGFQFGEGKLAQFNVERKTVPMSDCHDENLASHFDEAFEFINKAAQEYESVLIKRSTSGVDGGDGASHRVRRVSLKRHDYSRILVHCRRGISRSAAIVTAYLMASEGISFDAAFGRVLERRNCVSLNLAFQEKLSEYQPTRSWLRPVLREHHHYYAFGYSHSGSEGVPEAERTLTNGCTDSLTEDPKSIASHDVLTWKDGLAAEPHGSPISTRYSTSDWN